MGRCWQDSITLGTGADTIWFGATNGNDTITGAVTTTDTVKFYDKSVSQIAQAYSFDSTGKILSNGTDSMNFTTAAVTGVTVADNAGVTTKAAAATVATGKAAYATDTKVYFGTTAASAAYTGTTASALTIATATATTLDLDNGKNGVSFGDAYFNNFSVIDGTALPASLPWSVRLRRTIPLLLAMAARKCGAAALAQMY